VGQHDALGEAGCSRRINQRGDTLRGVDGTGSGSTAWLSGPMAMGPSPAASWITALCRLACSRACAETLVV